MGGHGDLVETDESLFHGKRKYNRSRLHRGNDLVCAGGAACAAPVGAGGAACAAPMGAGSAACAAAVGDGGGAGAAPVSAGSAAAVGGVPRRNHGRYIVGLWAFGLQQRRTGELRPFHVPRRDEATPTPVIFRHVAPGTHMYVNYVPTNGQHTET